MTTYWRVTAAPEPRLTLFTHIVTGTNIIAQADHLAITSSSLQPGDVVGARHAAVHDPDPLGEAEAGLHGGDDLFDGGHIRPVAGEHFVAQGNPVRRDHQANAHLQAVRPAVPRMASLSQRIPATLPLEIAAGHVVEEEPRRLGANASTGLVNS